MPDAHDVIDGKLYYNEQLQFATQGLITTAQSRHKIMNDGMPPFGYARRWQRRTSPTPSPATRSRRRSASRFPRPRADPCCSGQSNDAKRGGRRDREAAPRAQQADLAARRHPRFASLAATRWRRRCRRSRAAKSRSTSQSRDARGRRDLLVEAGANARRRRRGAGLSVQLLAVAQKLMHFMPDGLDSYGVLIDAALEEFKGEDPGWVSGSVA